MRASCYPQIVSLDKNAGLQSVINTIHARRQTSKTNLTFCSLYYLDRQERTSYTPFHQKQCLIRGIYYSIVGRTIKEMRG